MDDSKVQESSQTDQIEFKKPILFGRVGKLPKKVKSEPENAAVQTNVEKSVEIKTNSVSKHICCPNETPKELSPIHYREPKWSGLCPDGSDYSLEVLKSGMIVEKVELTTKPYYVFGRLANCDVILAHPTVSRHHAVLQYKAFADEGEPPAGWYLFDLASTHGTYINRELVKSGHYIRVHVGHHIRFGVSSRTYILLGPDFDMEGESELTVTEIKKKAAELKAEKERIMREHAERKERERLIEEKKREEQGIDWGMGEDAEEEPDLSENPYASTANEELYLDDPKKTLRGYFEREGHELNYDCEERGVGQFICRVELPIDDARGRPVMAEVIHKGKKKEAVVACALEACRILDRAGLLRQAKHESRRRKERDWSADDYYDSDEDTFLDRTGSVERKRRLRMEKHGAADAKEDKPLTYDDLLKQISEIEAKIASEERTLETLRARAAGSSEGGGSGDALDEFMSTLGRNTMAQKAEISRTKMSIQKLKTQLSRTQRLADVARPADMPPLVKRDPKSGRPPASVGLYGKRIKFKNDTEKKPKIKAEIKREESEFVEEVDSDEETESKDAVKSDKDSSIDNFNSQKTEQGSSKGKTEEKNQNESALVERDGDRKESVSDKDSTRVFGPMRPPEDYVAPAGYFDQISDRDLPEIEEKEECL